MKISFIATVLNEEKNIDFFINSILNQTKKPDEIIIIDGGSKDKTYEILKKYAKKNKKLKIFQKKGVNIAKGRNIAISKAKGDIIFVSDAGCIINKNWVKDTIEYFPKYDFVAGSYRAITKNNFELFQSLIVIKKVDRPTRMSGRNTAFKKKCWESVGGYSERYLTGEDSKFHAEIINKKYKTKINPQPLVSWEMRPTLSKFFKQFYLYGRGDRRQKNLFKKGWKKNLLMVFGFWAYLIILIGIVFIYPIISLLMVLLPLVFLFLYSFRFFIKTRRISALFWIPILILTKRLSYILGATFN